MSTLSFPVFTLKLHPLHRVDSQRCNYNAPSVPTTGALALPVTPAVPESCLSPTSLGCNIKTCGSNRIESIFTTSIQSSCSRPSAGCTQIALLDFLPWTTSRRPANLQQQQQQQHRSATTLFLEEAVAATVLIIQHGVRTLIITTECQKRSAVTHHFKSNSNLNVGFTEGLHSVGVTWN